MFLHSLIMVHLFPKVHTGVHYFFSELGVELKCGFNNMNIIVGAAQSPIKYCLYWLSWGKKILTVLWLLKFAAPAV